MRPLVVGLGDYGLDLGQLEGVAPRRLTYSFSLKGLDVSGLASLSPKDRMAAVSEHLSQSLSAIERQFSFDSIKPRDRKKPWISDAVSDVPTFIVLSRSRRVEYLFVNRIAGLRRHRKRAKPMSFFSVRARVAIQVEGQTSGMQDVEDRIVIVKAKSFEDAEKRLKGEWERYARPYLNPEGEMVRWQLEEIVDVYDVMEDTIDPKGTEVYSSFSARRMKPEYEWHLNRATSKGANSQR